MAISPEVHGAALIRIVAPGGSLESLGYTVNGADVSSTGYWDDVYSDRFGGESGPPIDVVFLSETAEISLLLSEWENSVLDKIHFNRTNDTRGTPTTVGTLMLGGSNTYRLLVNTTTEPLNFPTVIFRDVQEINKGTKHSRVRLSATAYPWNSGVLMDASTS